MPAPSRPTTALPASGPEPGRRPVTPRTALLLTLIGWVAVGMFIPLNPVRDPHQILWRLRAALALQLPEPVWRAVLARLICFVPIGLLLAHRRRPGRKHGPVLAGLTIVAVLEAAQACFAGRHPRLFDLALGWVTVMAGVVLAPWLARPIERIRPRLASRGLRLAMLIAAQALTVAAIAAAHTGVQTRGWDRRYPLLIGNEENADRPWRGEIAFVAFYDDAKPDRTIRTLARLRLQRGLTAALPAQSPIAHYDFRRHGDARVNQSVPGGPALPLRVPPEPPWRFTRFGLRCPGRGVTRNKGRATPLIERLTARGALTVETLVMPADTAQTGPARIVSISRSPSLRDLTIGQQCDRVAVRIRTPRTGANGAAVRCWTRPVLRAGEPAHIVVTFANGTVRVYVNGRQARRPLHLYRASCLILRNDHPAAGVLLALLIGWPLGMLASTRIRRQKAQTSPPPIQDTRPQLATENTRLRQPSMGDSRPRLSSMGDSRPRLSSESRTSNDQHRTPRCASAAVPRTFASCLTRPRLSAVARRTGHLVRAAAAATLAPVVASLMLSAGFDRAPDVPFVAALPLAALLAAWLTGPDSAPSPETSPSPADPRP